MISNNKKERKEKREMKKIKNTNQAKSNKFTDPSFKSYYVDL